MYALTERLGCLDLLCFLGHNSEGWRSCWWLDTCEPRPIQEWRRFQRQRGHDWGCHAAWMAKVGLFLLLSVSLSFLANLFAGSSCFKYSNREVRGSNKWLSLVWQVSVAAWCRGPMARCCSAVWSVFHSLSFTWLTEVGRIWRKHLAGEWIVLRTFLLLLFPLIEIYLFLCESVFLIAFFSEYLCCWVNFLCSFQHFTVSSSITTS